MRISEILKNPRRPRSPKDEALGFGIAEAVTFVTPVALAVITDVLSIWPCMSQNR